MPPDIKKIELGSSDQEASPSVGKNTGVVLVQMSQMEVCTYDSLGVIYYYIWVQSEGYRNYFEDWCLMNSRPTFLFLTYF